MKNVTREEVLVAKPALKAEDARRSEAEAEAELVVSRAATVKAVKRAKEATAALEAEKTTALEEEKANAEKVEAEAKGKDRRMAPKVQRRKAKAKASPPQRGKGKLSDREMH